MKLTDPELKKISEAKESFSNLKMTIADLEINKFLAMQELDKIRESFAIVESDLIEKYGEKATINMATGEVTHEKEETLLEKV